MVRVRCAGEEGQYVPVLALLVVVVLFGGFTLFEVGRAAALRAGGQSAADAAALAAAEEIRGQARDAVRAGAWEVFTVDHAAARSAAAAYADRNDADLVVYEGEGYAARVRVRGRAVLSGARARALEVEGTRGEAVARARLRIDWLPHCPHGACLLPPPPDPEAMEGEDEGVVEVFDPPRDPDAVARLVVRLVRAGG